MTVLRPNGSVLKAAPALPVTSSSLDAIPTGHDIPVWDGTPFDVVHAIDVPYPTGAAGCSVGPAPAATTTS